MKYDILKTVKGKDKQFDTTCPKMAGGQVHILSCYLHLIFFFLNFSSDSENSTIKFVLHLDLAKSDYMLNSV